MTSKVAFAEERELIELVARSEKNRTSFGRPEARGRNAGEVLEAGDQQVLAVVAVRAGCRSRRRPSGSRFRAARDRRSSCVHTLAFVASSSGASSV